MSKPKSPPPLLSPRAALVLALSILVGIGAGVLTRLAGAPSADAVITGVAATGVAVQLLNGLIGP
ncbi:MAG TPA: hypothetical protein VGL39_01505 [Jatrophihabitantaceae bacterium]|jgi:hypothetical protein